MTAEDRDAPRNGEEPDRPGPDPGRGTAEELFSRSDGYLVLWERESKEWVSGFTVDLEEFR